MIYSASFAIRFQFGSGSYFKGADSVRLAVGSDFGSMFKDPTRLKSSSTFRERDIGEF